MAFKEKLNLLMKVQNVSNIKLAKAISVDASLVSRWRSGTRTPYKNENYIKKLATYFSLQAQMDYQKAALLEIMGSSFENRQADSAFLCEHLGKWLNEEASPDTHYVDGFIGRLTMPVKSRAPIQQIDSITPSSSAPTMSVEILNGIEGKREGVIRFLTDAAAQEKPCTFLLFSDENLEWLTDDRDFITKWGALGMKLISKGLKIKIIHTINRDLSEMLSAINIWLPLYMTGAIEPYYYPKYNTGLFKKTMFIAPDVAALTSSALSEHSHNAEQFYYTSRSMIANLADEFYTYLGMCRPLMHIYTGSNLDSFSRFQLEFEEQAGDCISCFNLLSSVTMPEKLFRRLLDRAVIDEKQKKYILGMQEKRRQAFEANLEHNRVTELVVLPSLPASLWEASLPCPRDLFGAAGLYYTAEEFAEHVENVIYLLGKYVNYNLIPYYQIIPQNLYLSFKDYVGVITAKNDESPIVFTFNQQNMIHAFQSYLEGKVKETLYGKHAKGDIVKMLSDVADAFRYSCKVSNYS